jgi:cysteine-rich repeat protein
MNTATKTLDSKPGDLLTTKLEECDDGNLQNGDGCSNTSKVETSYKVKIFN